MVGGLSSPSIVTHRDVLCSTMADPGFVHESIKLEPNLRHSLLSEMEFQASKVIERLEEAAEKAAEGASGSPGGQAWKSMYGVLPLPSKTNPEIFRVLEDLLTYEDSSSLTEWAGGVARDEEEETPSPPAPGAPSLASLPVLDGVAKLAMVSQSLAALGAALERTHSQQLNSRLTHDCTRWLSHLFRFKDSTALFHEDPLEGIVRITRLMLHYKYPKYQEDGFEALSSSPPVIYSSVASPLGVVQHLCRQLALPLRCVHPVPCNTLFGSQQKMDVAELERLMDSDKANNQVPLIVLADAGTIIAGHVDNLARLQEVCEKHDVWLHLRGHSLAALTLSSTSTLTSSKPAKLADSLTLPIGTWLGVPALPIVTLYRPCRSPETDTVSNARESTLPLIAGLVSDSSPRRLISLPLWTTLQALGRDGIQSRIRRAFETSEIIWKAVSNYPCLSLLSQQPGGEAGAFTVSEIISKPVNTTVLLEVVACTVVFQFVPQNSDSGENSGRVPPYYDKLNTWLGHILQQECPQLVVDLCELESHGVVLRYCPLELSTDSLPSQEDIDHFTSCLEQQLEVLTATVQLKEVFQQTVARCSSLQLVQDMADWAGLGGVRYVPDGWELLQAEQRREELNRLNMQLVDRLQSTDQAFSQGEDGEGMAYVRFGMVTAGSDVEELLELVLTVGKEVEESSRFLETMTQVVKKGIEAATLDLQKENEERLWQEGILRQVPVVGSLVNWWSPRSKEGGIKGRSLNLNAGVVESTENIYRYHMQLQGGSGTSGAPGTRVTPTPMVQTPVGAVSGSQHSRSSSLTSQTSQMAVTSPSAVVPVAFSSNTVASTVSPVVPLSTSTVTASPNPISDVSAPSTVAETVSSGVSPAAPTSSSITVPSTAASTVSSALPSEVLTSVTTSVK